MGYPKDGREGLAALQFINTVPHDEIDPPAIHPGEDPPPVSSWLRYKMLSRQSRDAETAKRLPLPSVSFRDLEQD